MSERYKLDNNYDCIDDIDDIISDISHDLNSLRNTMSNIHDNDIIMDLCEKCQYALIDALAAASESHRRIKDRRDYEIKFGDHIAYAENALASLIKARSPYSKEADDDSDKSEN